MGITGKTSEAESICYLPVTDVRERFKSLRIVDPPAEKSILNSMRQYGQLTPVVVWRVCAGEHELLDGFKRLRAARQLGMTELSALPLEVSLRAGKAAMLQLNRVGRSISVMEEALVVHSLCHEDGLSQMEASELLGRHKSWVSRRVALIARLCDEAQERIRLGLLPASLGSELSRLQRCNQQQMLEAITRHHLTWRETRKVISILQDKPLSSYQQLLSDPRQAIAGEADKEVYLKPDETRRLGSEARTLRQELLVLTTRCLETALFLSGIDLGRFETEEEQILLHACDQALEGLIQVEQELKRIKEGDRNGDHCKQS